MLEFRKLDKGLVARVLLCASLTFSLLCPGAHAAADPPSASWDTAGTPNVAVLPTDELTKKILLDLVNLARFNLHYRQASAKQGRWKGLRYFGFQEANAGLTEASLIVGVSERMSHIRDRDFLRLHAGALEHGNVLGAVGQTIGASGSMLEFMINGYHSAKASRDGFSPAAGSRYVKSIVKKVDQEITELSSRCQADQQYVSADAAHAHACEVRILGDLRDLLVNEFDGFHIGARRILWTQQSFYLLDTAKNVTGALGNLFGYKAVRQHRRRFNQPAGVLNTVSGALIIINPILSRLMGRCMSTVDRHLLKASGLTKVEGSMAKLDADYKELDEVCHGGRDRGDSAVASVLNREDVYARHRRHFVEQFERSSKEIRAGNRIAVQNILSAMFVGGTKLSYGIQFDVAGFKYVNDPRMTNVQLGTGPIAYLAGTSYALLDNLRIQVMREITNVKLAKKHQLPGQLIKDQLNQLDEIERSVNSL